MMNSIVNYIQGKDPATKTDTFSRNSLHTLSLHTRYLTIYIRAHIRDMERSENWISLTDLGTTL